MIRVFVRDDIGCGDLTSESIFSDTRMGCARLGIEIFCRRGSWEDIISIGALAHPAPSCDIGMDRSF